VAAISSAPEALGFDLLDVPEDRSNRPGPNTKPSAAATTNGAANRKLAATVSGGFG